MAGLLRHDLQIRLPHVAADEGERRGPLLAEPAEEPEQRFGASILADPQQTLTRDVDLIHERQEVGPVLPMDFIDADRANAGEIHVITAPRHRHRDGPEHLVPAGAEDARDLLPTEALGPRREEPHVGGGQLVFAVGPGHPLDGDATAPAIDASHDVEEEDAQAPQRDEFETPRRQPVVHRPRLAASRAPRPIAAMRRDVDRQREAGDLLLELHRAVDKPPVLLNPIQDSLDVHPAVRLRRVLVCVGTTILSEATRDASSPTLSRVEADGSVDAQNAPTDPCKTTERFCTSFHTPHRLFRRTKDQNLSVCWDSDPQILRRRRKVYQL